MSEIKYKHKCRICKKYFLLGKYQHNSETEQRVSKFIVCNKCRKLLKVKYKRKGEK